MLNNYPDDLESLFHLIYETMQLPLYCMNPQGGIDFTIPYRPIGSFAYPDSGTLLEQLKWNEIGDTVPVIRVLANTETYIIIKLTRGKHWSGTIIAGPIIQSEVRRGTIDRFLKEQQIVRKRKIDALRYYSRQSVKSYAKIQQTALLLYYMIYGKRIEMETLVQETSNPVIDIVGASGWDIESDLSLNRQNEFYHHSFAAQSAIFLCVRDGDVSRLRRTLNASLDGERGILCKSNPLRNQKNFAICGTALATRSAIEGGLDSEVAYTLSDRYIQQYEDVSDLLQVVNLHYRMLYEFTELVQKVRSTKFSYAVKQCRAYIDARLLEEIDYNRLAKHVSLNKHYLADLFKKEMNVTIGEYIRKERIEEAKRMLLNDHLSLSDIAQTLRFYDQSHFTRTFKKWSGITPKQYRIQARK